MTQVWVGRVLPQAAHVTSLPLVRHQIFNFLTEELLNSLEKKMAKANDYFEGFHGKRFTKQRIMLLFKMILRGNYTNNSHNPNVNKAM